MVTTLSDFEPGPDGKRSAQGMAHLRQLSQQTRAVHTACCRQLTAGETTLQALCAQALFDRDIATLPLRRALIALPNLGAKRAGRVMTQVALPASRRIGWLAQHPEMMAPIQDAIQQVLFPARRKPPGPHWPWFGTVVTP
jgi:hypothetical protein